MQTYIQHGLPLAPRMEISYVVKGAKKWEVDPERTPQSSMNQNTQGCWRRLGGRWRFVQLVYGQMWIMLNPV